MHEFWRLDETEKQDMSKKFAHLLQDRCRRLAASYEGNGDDDDSSNQSREYLLPATLVSFSCCVVSSVMFVRNVGKASLKWP